MKRLADVLPPRLAEALDRLRDDDLGDDVLDPPSCTRCNDAGHVLAVRTDDVTHPKFGTFVPCRCALQADDLERPARLLRFSTLDRPLLARMTFDAWTVRRSLPPEHEAALEKALLVARAYAREPHGFLTLQGAFGAGKSHLAAAIAHERIRSGQLAIFAGVPDILDHLRSSYRPGAEVQYDELFARWKAVPLLVLDDLGAESSTPWATEKLYQLIDHRYRELLPTVVTTNLHEQRLDPRVFDRLADRTVGQIITLAGVPSYRRSGAAKGVRR